MEENIQKILNEKDENVVQFNIANTTPNDISIDLFNLDTLISTPTTLTYSSLPNTLISSFGNALAYQFGAINTNNGYLYFLDGTTNVDVFDTNNNNAFLFSITLPNFSNTVVYNSNDNTLYFVSSLASIIYVYDGSTNLQIATIPFGGGSNTAIYIPTTNTIYLSDFAGTDVIDCNTNTISFGLIISYDDFVFNPTNGLVYATEGIFNVYDTIDPLINTVIQSIPFPSSSIGNNPNPLTPFNYITDTIGDVYIFNWSTGNTLVTSFSPSIGNLGFSVYDPMTNNVYFGSNSGNILIVNGANTFQTSFISLSLLFEPYLSPSTNSIFFGSPFTNSIVQVTTTGIATSNFYISGSTNYNTFVNSLNNEPIFIGEIRILTQNLTQLNNQVQFTKIDSSGNQIFFPEFPINKIDIDQNNNIAELKLNGLVFDGRTYINKYVINPNQVVSFEIYYKQLDRLSATPTFPIFFKPKVQLKEYIKKELNL